MRELERKINFDVLGFVDDLHVITHKFEGLHVITYVFFTYYKTEKDYTCR